MADDLEYRVNRERERELLANLFSSVSFDETFDKMPELDPEDDDD